MAVSAPTIGLCRPGAYSAKASHEYAGDASADAKTDTGRHRGPRVKGYQDATLEYQQAVDGCTAQATKETAGSFSPSSRACAPGPLRQVT